MILRNAHLISYLTEGFNGPAADLRIGEEEGRIEAVDVPGRIPAKPREKETDLEGRTVLPGLFDLHMHLYFLVDDFYRLAADGAAESTVNAVAYANTFLDYGFTTIRDCGNPHYIGVALRDAIEDGRLEGPRIITAGKCISPCARGNDTFPGLYYEVNTPQEVFSAGRDEAARGVDFLKYMATGSVANRTGIPGQLIATKPELQALQDAADEAGIYVGVHCHGTAGILMCAEVGVRTVEHASFTTADCIERILARGGKTVLIPTLNPVVGMHNEFAATGERNYMTEKIEACYSAASGLVEAAGAGVLLGWGTDTSRRSFLREPGLEFLARRQVGFSNRQILEQATVNSARAVFREKDFGTVAAGKIADLVVIDGDPDNNIEVMTRKPVMVFKGGRRVR